MIVEATGLRKAYGKNLVLDDIDVRVPEGSVYGLLGPNGAGKTTTIRILATLLRPDGGSARVAGYDVVREPLKVRGVISLTGQYAAVDDEQTGRENLVMIGQLMHLGRRQARARAVELIERFDLVEAFDRRVKTYSGGMRRRLDLAMSLVGHPRVIFLDEPTTGLDPGSRTTMWEVVKDLVRDGTTIVLTTQYLEEADRLADWIAMIHGGKLVAEGTPDTLKAQVGGERVDLHFDSSTDVARAAALLGSASVPGRDDLVLGVLSDGSAAQLHRILDTLRADGIAVSRVSAHRPTLDDVFMTLTGTAAEAEPELAAQSA